MNTDLDDVISIASYTYEILMRPDKFNAVILTDRDTRNDSRPVTEPKPLECNMPLMRHFDLVIYTGRLGTKVLKNRYGATGWVEKPRDQTQMFINVLHHTHAACDDTVVSFDPDKVFAAVAAKNQQVLRVKAFLRNPSAKTVYFVRRYLGDAGSGPKSLLITDDATQAFDDVALQPNSCLGDVTQVEVV